MDLFIILTLEMEVHILRKNSSKLRKNSSNVVICCMDMDVLLCNCESCNFCLIMEMAGSSGTNVKRAFTS